MIYIVLLLALVAFFFFARKLKLPPTGALTLVTGGVKCGKSTLSVYLVFRNYFNRLLHWYVDVFFWIQCGFLVGTPPPEKPLVYTNVPLCFPKKWLFVPIPRARQLTTDLALRKTRFPYRSICYVQECSLFADSMAFKNAVINEELLEFNKLIAHETRGGSLVYDTQSLEDCHYTIKRSVSSMLYCHKCFKIPLLPFCVVKCRELLSIMDTVNIVSEDAEEKCRFLLVPSRVWKYFDCYTYSAMTDSLPVDYSTEFRKEDGLKTTKIITLKRS